MHEKADLNEVGLFSLRFCTLRELHCSTSADEVHDDGDNREDQEQVDEEAGGVKHDESAKPKNYENDCENEKHDACFPGPKGLALARGYRA